MSELKQLSIVIVTWNGDEMLARCLKSLACACGNAPEIIVVDNANSASTLNIANQFTNVTYVATDRNLGFAGGNNVGLRHCHRDFVALLNNDTIVHNEPFSILIQYLCGHEQVGVVQGTLVMTLKGGRPDACGVSVTRDGNAIERLYESMNDVNVLKVSSVYAAKGALAVFRRSLPEKVGGLFHDFYFNNFEDVEFCGRVCLSGYEVHYVPTPPVEHLCSQSLVRLDKSKLVKQTLYNLLVTWLIVLSPSYAIRSVVGYMSWAILGTLGTFVHYGDVDGIGVMAATGRKLWKTRDRISKLRHEVQALRKISDRELFRRVGISLPLHFHINRLRGRNTEFDWK